MTKINTLFLFIFLLATSLSAQKSQNVSMLDRWDNDDLPTHFFGTFNDLWGYVADDREYIIMGSASYIHFFDVSDPTNIIHLDSIAGGSSITWRDFKTYGDRAYCVSDNSGEGLIVIDLSDLPNSVTVVSQNNSVFSSAHNCFIDEANGRLYVCGSDMDMVVFDIATDPGNPIHLASVNLPGGGYVHDLYVRDNIAYCSSDYSGLYVWDFTDPTTPVYIASVVTGAYNHSSWVSEDGSYAIFAEEVPSGLPLGTLDLTGMMEDNIEVNTYFQELLLDVPDNDLKNTAHNPMLVGDIAYVSYYEDGLHVYDCSNPSEPILIAYYDTYPSNDDPLNSNYGYNGYAGCWGIYPFFPSGNIFVSDMDNGLFALQVDLLSSTKETFDAASNLTVFPNPAMEELTIQLESVLPQDFSYSLTTVAGQEVETGAFVAHGKTRTSFSVAHLAEGMYFLNLKNKDQQLTQKVLITK